MKKITLTLFLGITLLYLYSCQKEDPTSQLLLPEANFSASSTSIYKGMTVDFIDLSTISPYSWAWTFSGGTPAASNQQNPTVQYTTPGVYDVSLTVSNNDGSNTKTLTGHITVNDATVQVLLDNNLSLDDILTTYPMDSLYGKQYQGGLIFYHNSNQYSSRTLVAAAVDQSSSVYWGCSGANLTGFNCSGSSIGGYSLNGTIACLGASTAWGMCDYLVYNNYNDWELPSATTLVYMYQNLHLKGYGNFTPDYYWSYCETDDYNSKSVTFNNGSISDYSSKNSSRRVRAIREYYFTK